jgi:hypothetical protein
MPAELLVFESKAAALAEKRRWREALPKVKPVYRPSGKIPGKAWKLLPSAGLAAGAIASMLLGRRAGALGCPAEPVPQLGVGAGGVHHLQYTPGRSGRCRMYTDSGPGFPGGACQSVPATQVFRLSPCSYITTPIHG